nr:hypothetical protein [Tanacetum cinerariifolium]
MMMYLAMQFDNASAAKQDLRQAYEKCNDIPQETPTLIDTFLKRESDKDYEINLAMYRKAGKIEKQIESKYMAMLTMGAKIFLKNTGKKMNINGTKTIGFDKSKVECYNRHQRGHFAKEYKALRNHDNKNMESTMMNVPVETSTLSALVLCDGLDESANKPITSNPIVETSEAKNSEEKPKEVRNNNKAPIIKD